MAAGERLNDSVPQSSAVALRQRAHAMLDRVTVEAQAVLPHAEASVVRGALAHALSIRDRTIEDDHDPRYLHPARTIRILIADGGCRDVTALVAAAFTDTVDPGLAPSPPTAALRSFVAAIPRPDVGKDDLLERLVIADPAVALVALVERLDHARHIHLRDDLPWPPFHADIRSIYLPAARRFSPVIARRLEHWADAFERRLILPL